MSNRYRENIDEKGFPLDSDGSPTPLFLETVVGSLAEERRDQINLRAQRAKRYNKLREFALEKLEKRKYSVFNLLVSPDEVIEKLASLRGEYPDLDFDLNINVGSVIKQKVSSIRSFLFWFISLEEIPGWLEMLFCEQFDSILIPEKLISGSVRYSELRSNIEYYEQIGEDPELSKYIQITENSQKFREALAIYQIYQVYGRTEAWQLVNQIYSENTLKKWIQTGESLARNYCVIRCPRYVFKDKVRRRGYSHSSHDPNSLRSQKGKVSKMIQESSVNQQLEETISRIKLKQAQLFEKRLDVFLELESDLPQEIKKEVFQRLLDETIPSKISKIEDDSQSSTNSEGGRQ